MINLPDRKINLPVTIPFFADRKINLPDTTVIFADNPADFTVAGAKNHPARRTE
jgi:hypothetical protein